jgi:hypothetical protein
MIMRNAELLQGLRDLIGFIEANDDIDFGAASRPAVEMNFRTWYLHDLDVDGKKEVLADVARRLGSSEKVYGDEYFWLNKDFGSHVRFTGCSQRTTVCERIVTGKRVVPAEPAHLIPAQPEQEIEVVEWRCHPLLASEEASIAQ